MLHLGARGVKHDREAARERTTWRSLLGLLREEPPYLLVASAAIVHERDRLRLCAEMTLHLRCAGTTILLALGEDVCLPRNWRADLSDLRGGLDLKPDDHLAVVSA